MIKHISIALGASLLLAAPVTAQEAADSAAFPAICQSDMDMGSTSMEMTDMDQAHNDLSNGLDKTNAQMMQGMMAEDIDVAFVCSMIPHHQAAINMAKAELEHGDNDWAKQMAQNVIDAQQKEIQDMLSWLGEQK